MKKFIKGAFTKYSPEISSWDLPVERVFDGKKVVGRPTKAYGESEFKYAGKLYKPDPWTSSISIIKHRAEALVRGVLKKRVNFTFCLCALYKHGGIAIPHHSDTVPTRDSLVISISFGAPRLFEWNQYSYYIKRKTNTSKTHILHHWKNQLETTRYILEHGDVILFDGESQMTSTHAVPSLEETGERINLTFRTDI
tara:strand:- start:270 stop:857 length:588 start_codon:yes stop_codon:yes gene_type:complete